MFSHTRRVIVGLCILMVCASRSLTSGALVLLSFKDVMQESCSRYVYCLDAVNGAWLLSICYAWLEGVSIAVKCVMLQSMAWCVFIIHFIIHAVC